MKVILVAFVLTLHAQGRLRNEELMTHVSGFNDQLARARDIVKGSKTGFETPPTRSLLFGAEDDNCKTELAKCEAAASAPSFMFVQMANHCTMRRKDGVHTLSSEDMADKTWSFSDRPFKLEDTYVPSHSFSFTL